MERDYWLRQAPDKPLFPDLEWSRPQNKQQAGKLLIIGGNLHGFAAPGEAYAQAVNAGIGTARVVLPGALQKLLGRVLENGEYAPSTPSGSFSQKALGDLLAYANWADGVLLAGDLGRNSETAILLEAFLRKSPAPVTLTKDAVDYVTSAPQAVLQRPHTLLVLSLSQLQRLAIATRSAQPVTFGMSLLQLVDWLHHFSQNNAPYIIVRHGDHLCVAVRGKVTTTRHDEQRVWRLLTAAHASVWWLQNPTRPLEALTASTLAV